MKRSPFVRACLRQNAKRSVAFEQMQRTESGPTFADLSQAVLLRPLTTSSLVINSLGSGLDFYHLDASFA